MDNLLAALPYFLLVLVRLTSFFLIAPIFAMKGMPAQFKIGLAAFLALIVASGAGETAIALDGTYILLILKEFAVGLALGFVATLLLYAVQVAGAFIDFQMGFAMANVLDPQTGQQVPIVGQFKYMLALLFMLAVNGHHMLLDGIMHSFRLVPVEAAALGIEAGGIASFISALFIQMFMIALQISLPIVGALFLVDVALGILSKTVPQMNIFAVGFPVKIFTGFVLILLSMPVFFYLLQLLFEKMMESIAQLAHMMGGG